MTVTAVLGQCHQRRTATNAIAIVATIKPATSRESTGNFILWLLGIAAHGFESVFNVGHCFGTEPFGVVEQ